MKLSADLLVIKQNSGITRAVEDKEHSTTDYLRFAASENGWMQCLLAEG